MAITHGSSSARTKTLRLLIAVLAAAAAAGASDVVARGAETGTLQLQATIGGGYSFVGRAGCPAGTPSTTIECISFIGTENIPGLGRVTESYTKSFDPSICPNQVTSFKIVTLEVAGKGTIEVSMEWPACGDPAALNPTGTTVVLAGTITQGTGKFAGASGNLKVTNHVNPPSTQVSGAMTDVWTGTIVVPGLDFDLTPPVLNGARNLVVKAPKKAKKVRVRYRLSAQDAVDGAVPVKCKPASGGRFKVGRTKVACTADDSSANRATARFTVTVIRRR
jgi:HYR domain